jgi:hypothetical protein
MIQAEKLAKTIENELNANKHTVAFKKHFKIYANVGDYNESFNVINKENTQEINGVIKANNGEYTQVKDVNNLFITYTFECAIQQEFVDELQLILSDWCESLIGETFSDDEWTYLISPSPIYTGLAVDTTALGSTIPLTMNLSFQMVQKGIISNQEKWQINGYDVNVIYNNVSSMRTTKSSTTLNQNETKVINQFTTQSITMTIPFVANEICIKLINDILQGNKDEIYTITMSDGITAGISGEFLMTQGQKTAENGKIISIQCAFQTADTLIL